jgi:F-type H+-transporting ATPase subunit b
MQQHPIASEAGKYHKFHLVMNLITPDIGILFWQTVTLLAVLVVLAKFGWKPILSKLKERETAVAHAVAQIAEAHTLMEQVYTDRTKLINEVQMERERIISEALRTQQEIIEQARQEGLKTKEKLILQAKLEISKEQERALETLKANVGMLAVQLAEKLLDKELEQTPAQWELLDRLTTEQGSAYNQPKHNAL